MTTALDRAIDTWSLVVSIADYRQLDPVQALLLRDRVSGLTAALCCADTDTYLPEPALLRLDATDRRFTLRSGEFWTEHDAAVTHWASHHPRDHWGWWWRVQLVG